MRMDHLILSAYRFCLPNDLRGSWSTTVREYHLRAFSPATKVTTTRSLAREPHDGELRLAATRALRYKPVRFIGVQAVSIAKGFGVAKVEHDYTIHALAILPDHVHLIIKHPTLPIDRIAAHLKAKATMQLNAEGIHPFANSPRADGSLPSPWARNFWAPRIESEDHLAAAIDYVNQNPGRSGLRRQHWSIVEGGETLAGASAKLLS